MLNPTGDLYSGMTSKSQIKARKKREALTAEVEEKMSKVLPFAEEIEAELNSERESIAKQVLDYVSADAPEENIKATLLALKISNQRALNLKTRLHNIVRAQERRLKREAKEAENE